MTEETKRPWWWPLLTKRLPGAALRAAAVTLALAPAIVTFNKWKSLELCGVVALLAFFCFCLERRDRSLWQVPVRLAGN